MEASLSEYFRKNRLIIMIDLSVVIVNYNVKQFLSTLIDSLYKSSNGIESEIIIVDNNSNDGSVEEIADKFPDVKIIANKENLGFGKANNQGMALAKGKYILLINPDTMVREDTLSKMIKFLEGHPDAGMVGCKVLNPDGTLQLACRRGFPGPWTSFTKVAGLSKIFPKSKIFSRYNLTYLDENETHYVDAISGAFMFFKREVYEATEGFDPMFFMYGEDLDLCYRTQQAGYKVYYFPYTEIIHYKGESTKRSNLDETRVFYEAMHLFVKKHFSSSILVEVVLQSAIIARKFLAFLNLYRLPIFAALIDMILFCVALLFVENNYRPSGWKGIPEIYKPWVYIIPAFSQVIIGFISGAYRRNTLSIFRGILSLVAGVIVLSSLTFFLKQYAFSRVILLVTYLVAAILFFGWRFISKVFFKIGLSDTSGNPRTLIVGEGNKGLELSEKLKSNLVSIYSIIGFIGLSNKSVGAKLGNYSIVGSIDNIRKVIEEKKIDKVIFLSNEISFDKMFGIVDLCHGQNVDFLVAGNDLDFLVGKSAVTMLENIPLLKISYNITMFGHRFTKRLFDLFLSVSILLLLYPIIYFSDKLASKRSFFSKFVLSIPGVVSGSSVLSVRERIQK